jgi:hypothetical protein
MLAWYPRRFVRDNGTKSGEASPHSKDTGPPRAVQARRLVGQVANLPMHRQVGNLPHEQETCRNRHYFVAGLQYDSAKST